MRFNPAVLLSAAAVAHGFNNSIGPPGISYGDNLPLDNTSYIDSFRTIYNATSHASFAGPNVSTPLPVGGSYPEHQGNWSMDLFIVADAEPAGSRPDQKPFYTAISIEMRGPEGFRAATDMDRSWTVCNSVALIDAKGHKAVNGSCEGILSDECQKSAYTKATDCSASFFQNGGDKCGLQLKYAVAGCKSNMICDRMGWNGANLFDNGQPLEGQQTRICSTGQIRSCGGPRRLPLTRAAYAPRGTTPATTPPTTRRWTTFMFCQLSSRSRMARHQHCLDLTLASCVCRQVPLPRAAGRRRQDGCHGATCQLD